MQQKQGKRAQRPMTWITILARKPAASKKDAAGQDEDDRWYRAAVLPAQA